MKYTYRHEFKKIRLYVEDWFNYITFMENSIRNIFSEYLLIESKVGIMENNPYLLITLIEENGYTIKCKIIANIFPVLEISCDEYVFSVIERILKKVEEATIYYVKIKGSGTIYFVFTPRQQISLTRRRNFIQKILEKIVWGNMIFFFTFSLIVFYLLSIVVGSLYALILTIPLINLPIMIFSDKILDIIGDWDITRYYRSIYIISLKFPLKDYVSILRKIGSQKKNIKKMLYINALSFSDNYLKQKIKNLFKDMIGTEINEEDITIRKIDLYSLVDSVFLRFRLPTPRIKILNVKYPNVMISGLMLNKSTLLITTGILVNLKEEELRAVIGHEASHAKNHDQLFFFSISSIEYLVRIYIINVLNILSPISEVIYLSLSLTILFLIAKIIEIRADIEASILLNKSIELASALKKIGVNHVVKKRKNRVLSWILWKTHPPITFRIENLLSVNSNQYNKNLFLTATYMCIKDIEKNIMSVWKNAFFNTLSVRNI